MGREINCCQNQQNYLHTCRSSINYFVSGGPCAGAQQPTSQNSSRVYCTCQQDDHASRVDTDAIMDDTSEERPRAREDLLQATCPIHGKCTCGLKNRRTSIRKSPKNVYVPQSQLQKSRSPIVDWTSKRQNLHFADDEQAFNNPFYAPGYPDLPETPHYDPSPNMEDYQAA